MRNNTPRTLALACLLTFVLLAAPAAAAGPAALSPTYNSLGAAYIGPQTVHLSYSVTDNCWYHHCRYLLKGTPSGGGTPVELRQENSASGDYIFAGAFHHSGLDARTYSYSVVVERYDSANVLKETTTLLTSHVVVTGDQAGGALLFDEALQGAVVCASSIVVPTGRTLTIAQTQLALLPDGYCTIRVYGTLALDAASTVSVAHFSLYAPHSFADLAQVTLTFGEGSDGSSLTGGSNLIVDTAAELSVQDTNGLSLIVDRPHGAVSVRNVKGFSSPYMLLADDTSVALDDIEWTGADMLVEGACPSTDCLAIRGTLGARNLTAPGALTMRIVTGAGVTIQNSFFRGPVELTGATGHPVLIQNEFAGRVTLSQNTDARLQDNVFMDAVELRSWCYFGETPTPTIDTNSFVGNQALVTDGYWQCQNKIPIGANYYGDRDGPSMTGGQLGFLRRGAYVDGTGFAVAPANVSGRHRSDKYVFPRFWLNNYLGEARYRVGQGLLTDGYASMVQGKETLLSLDLVTSDQTVSNVQVYAVFDGRTVKPTGGGSVTLHRDSADYGRNANDLGRSTVNFILPATNKASATLEVWLDTLGVTGYDTTGSLTQITGLPSTLYFQPPPARALRIAVIPVRLPTGTGAAGPVVAMLQSVLPAMFPIPAGMVDVRVLPPLVHKTTHWTTTGLLNSLASNLELRRAFLNSYADRYGQPRDVTDFIVAVMPNGSLGGADGANMVLRRGVVFVEEDTPEAAIHEMGHGIGLYTTVEQYNWPNYPDMGMPLQNVTAFLGVQSTTDAATNASFASCDAGRICHIPADNVYWYIGQPLWYDVMGVGLLNQWPSASTIEAFRTYFASLTTAAAAAASPTGSGRALAISGQTRRVESVDGWTQQPCLDWQIVPDTVRIAQIAPLGAAVGQTLAAPAGEAQAPSAADGLPLCSYSAASRLYFRYYNASGSLLDAYILVNEITGREAGRDYDAFMTTVTLYSDDVARLEVAQDDLGPALAVFTGSGPLTTQILEPMAGATLPGGASRANGPTQTDVGDAAATFTLRWQTTGAAPAGQPLQNLIEYSTDGGATWRAAGLPIEGDQIALPVSAFPQSSNLALRVTASDGIRAAPGQVTGLTRPNLPPVVAILSPANGARGVTGTRWMLRASAYDPEQGSGLTGTWSTVTGTLGSGANLSGVLLPPGTHTLTYQVVDQGGATVSASVQVTVGPMTTVDLALPADALAVQPPQRDPTVGTTVSLVRGLTNTVALQVRNTGAVVTATLSLYVTPPGGAETLLAQRSLALQPFERIHLVAGFVPGAAGSYTFRGALSDVIPTDTNPANDARTWTYAAAEPARLTIVNVPPLDAGTAAIGFPQQVALTLTNSGGSILTVRRITLEGAGAGNFGLGQDYCTLATLAPDATCVAMVRFDPVADGLAEAVLRIASSDALQVEQTLAVRGVGVAPKRIYLPLILRGR